jgi:hypothetical protein
VPHRVQCLTAGASAWPQPMQTGLEYPRNRGFAFWHSRWSYRNIWVRLTGPGRVAVQSVYTPPEDTEVIQNSSYATQHRW